MENAVTLGKTAETVQSSEGSTYLSVLGVYRIIWSSKESKHCYPLAAGTVRPTPSTTRPAAHHLRPVPSPLPSPLSTPLPLRAHPGDGQRGAEIFTAHQTKTPRRRATQDHRVGHSGDGTLPAHGRHQLQLPLATTGRNS